MPRSCRGARLIGIPIQVDAFVSECASGLGADDMVLVQLTSYTPRLFEKHEATKSLLNDR